MEINVSKGFENYSQRNNVLVPNSACGPTNFIQGLEYSGWVWNNKLFPELKQPEDKLTKFCRTNKDVLAYYEKYYKNLYDNWMAEAHQLAKEQKKQYWEVDCKKNYPPNEIHDVMNYAANLFIGYTAKEVSKIERPVCRFFNSFEERTVLCQLDQGLPVVSSVNFNGYGHYITIVGYTSDETKEIILGDQIKEYIIDNTYGRFNFKTNKYDAVSGNDEHIPRDKFLTMIKPVMHIFTKGAAKVC